MMGMEKSIAKTFIERIAALNWKRGICRIVFLFSVLAFIISFIGFSLSAYYDYGGYKDQLCDYKDKIYGKKEALSFEELRNRYSDSPKFAEIEKSSENLCKHYDGKVEQEEWQKTFNEVLMLSPIDFRPDLDTHVIIVAVIKCLLIGLFNAMLMFSFIWFIYFAFIYLFKWIFIPLLRWLKNGFVKT